MTLGTGIFLGLALCALVYLYSVTKDRWRWPRIVRLSFTWIVILCLGLVGIYLAVEGYNSRAVRNSRQMAYMGVSLGDSYDEVHYALGPPATVLEDLEPELTDRLTKFFGIVRTESIPDGKNIRDYSYWSYSDKERSREGLTVSFDTKGHVVEIRCYHSDDAPCDSILGIDSWGTETGILERLGKPSRSHFSGDAKIMVFDRLNAGFYLSKRRVYGFVVGISPDTPSDGRSSE